MLMMMTMMMATLNYDKHDDILAILVVPGVVQQVLLRVQREGGECDGLVGKLFGSRDAFVQLMKSLSSYIRP